MNRLYSKDSSISFPYIQSFAEDSEGKIWVNSADGWYGYIDSNTPLLGIRKKYNLKNHGITESLIQLASDKYGNVWGYTEKLLIRINRGPEQLQTFDFAYGAKVVDFFHFSFLTGSVLGLHQCPRRRTKAKAKTF